MICHHKKCIFVHIPKNAGQSIEHVFLKLLNLKWETRAPLLLYFNDRPELGPPRLAHLKAVDYVNCGYVPQEMFDEYFKFSFVRNPWDRLVSMYKYLGFQGRYTFKSFVMTEFKNKLWREMYWFVGPKSEFVCDDDGQILMDFIGKFENLQNDFYQICGRIGLPPTEVPHVNKTETETTASLGLRPKQIAKYLLYLFRRRHISNFKRYQDYYDSETRALVEELYKRDIELFGYEFDEPGSFSDSPGQNVLPAARSTTVNGHR